MFASFFGSKSRRPSETTPLLAALNKYRRRQNGEDSGADDNEPDAIAQYDGEDEDEDEDRQRDGPLLPVFSSEVLGMRRFVTQELSTVLTAPQIASPYTTPPTRFV
jgi:hypothetical protein